MASVCPHPVHADLCVVIHGSQAVLARVTASAAVDGDVSDGSGGRGIITGESSSGGVVRETVVTTVFPDTFNFAPDTVVSSPGDVIIVATAFSSDGKLFAAITDSKLGIVLRVPLEADAAALGRWSPVCRITTPRRATAACFDHQHGLLVADKYGEVHFFDVYDEHQGEQPIVTTHEMGANTSSVAATVSATTASTAVTAAAQTPPSSAAPAVPAAAVTAAAAAALPRTKHKDADASSLPMPLPRLVLGHTGMVLSLGVAPYADLLVTADRESKLRVSRYPQTYDIEAYCLGHREFVSCMTFVAAPTAQHSEAQGHQQQLPQLQQRNLLVSGSGDGSLALWDYSSGANVRRLIDHRYASLSAAASTLAAQAAASYTTTNSGGKSQCASAADKTVNNDNILGKRFVAGANGAEPTLGKSESTGSVVLLNAVRSVAAILNGPRSTTVAAAVDGSARLSLFALLNAGGAKIEDCASEPTLEPIVEAEDAVERATKAIGSGVITDIASGPTGRLWVSSLSRTAPVYVLEDLRAVVDAACRGQPPQSVVIKTNVSGVCKYFFWVCCVSVQLVLF